MFFLMKRFSIKKKNVMEKDSIFFQNFYVIHLLRKHSKKSQLQTWIW